MKLELYVTHEKPLEPNRYIDLVARADADTDIIITFYDEDENTVDITDDEVYFMVKATPSTADDSASINKKVTTHSTPGSGETTISLIDTDTASLLGNYIWQCKIKHDDEWFYVGEGNICFKKSIISRES